MQGIATTVLIGAGWLSFFGSAGHPAFRHTTSVGSAAVPECDRISEIKRLPFKDSDEVQDPVYYALIEAGRTAIPCLIERLTDATPMADPRGIPGPTDTRVGDVAYFVLVTITGIGFTELLPEKVREQYKSQGAYAYHVFVEKARNRDWLQTALKDWYRRKYGKEH